MSGLWEQYKTCLLAAARVDRSQSVMKHRIFLSSNTQLIIPDISPYRKKASLLQQIDFFLHFAFAMANTSKCKSQWTIKRFLPYGSVSAAEDEETPITRVLIAHLCVFWWTSTTARCNGFTSNHVGMALNGLYCLVMQCADIDRVAQVVRTGLQSEWGMNTCRRA